MDKTERIKDDAEAYANDRFGEYAGNINDFEYPAWKDCADIYIAGATAENNRAQPAIDILEQIANSPMPANEREIASWIETAKTLAASALEQWKGTGKEVENEQSLHQLTVDEKKKLLSKKIENKIKEAVLQRQEFADLMGVQPSTITRWLSGDHNFEINTLFEIEKQLNIKLFNL